MLVDKPRGMTSHDVVDRVRKAAGMRKVGHTGTLDPMATGLLVICLGHATKVSRFLTGLPKQYTGTIQLGAVSSTYDAEGQITRQDQPVPSTTEEIRWAMSSQIGLHTQLAPPFSAVKVRGKKLYEYARAGEAVPEKHRRVLIQSFELIDHREGEFSFDARVGSGTYIRSMAHDLGAKLGCGAYLSALRRVTVGELRVEDAAELDALDTIFKDTVLLDQYLMNAADALKHLPHVTIDAEARRSVLHGQGFTTNDICEAEAVPLAGETVLVLDAEGEVVSVAQAELANSGKLEAPATRAGGDSDDSSDNAPGSASAPARIDSDSPLLYFRSIRVLARTD